MSTKTLRKRITLVAVSALGFGLLSATPSFAGEATASAITSITLTADSSTVAIGASSTITVTAAGAGSVTSADTEVILGSVISKPAGSVVALTTVAGETDTTRKFSYANTGSNANLAKVIATATATSVAGTQTFGTIALTSTVAGSVTLRVFHDAATADGNLTAGEAFQDIVITIASSTSGSPQLSDFPNSAVTTASTNGSLNGVIVSAVGVTTTSISGRTGTYVGFAPNYTLTRNAGASASDAGVTNATKSANINYSVTNPAGAAVIVYTAIAGTTASTEQYVPGSSTAIALGADNTVAVSQSAGAQKGTPVYFPTATAGTYTVTVYHDANRNDLADAGEASATSTFTINTDALPSITLTTYGQSTPAQAANNGVGQLVKIALTNGTAKAALAENESLTITGPTGTVIDNKSVLTGTSFAMADAGDGVSVVLTRANFDGSGQAFINVGNSTAGGGTYALTASISGGTANGASGSGSFTVVDTTTYPVDQTTANTNKAIVNANVFSVAIATSGVSGADIAAIADGAANATATWTIKRSTATTVAAKMVVGAVASKTFTATVTDTLGKLTGMKGAVYKVAKSTGATVTSTTAVTFSVAVPALSSSETSALTLALDVADAAGDTARTATITVTNASAVATTSYSNPTSDANSYTLRAAVASANKFTATVFDQFGNPLPNIAVNAAIAGRNSGTSVASMLTDSKGQVSYTLTDVYTGTTLLTDTLTFTPAAGATSSVTVNYATYLPASTVTLTTPDSANATATGIAGSITTDISSADGAEAGAVTVSAVVKDANGATLPAGVPVVWTITGNTGAAIVSTKATTYTDSTGKASTSVYAWLNGNATVTATAGTATKSGIVYFKQADCTAGSDCAEARKISAITTGNLVTATVTDRFGNPIKGVNVVATRKGTGTFNGTSSITGTTDKTGTVEFVLTNGTADVTVGFTSSTFGASAATKGYADAGITALTAYTAGTVSLAEAGVGASYDAAGVNSATVLAVTDTATLDTANAAADAAAEATDAANAATDAANAAAEAADAATAAAQDAADAVAALSTQVAEMIDALKKQITALTNLVIKIQKKVKA
jgi:hypothetical protein